MSENKLDLQAIRKRAEAADTGPWFCEDGNIYTKTEIAPGCPGMIAEFVYRDEAEFIAHARQDVPALIAEVERLREQQARLVGELEKADAFSDELKEKLFRCQMPDIRRKAKELAKEIRKERK
jgi:hypothetical protein